MPETIVTDSLAGATVHCQAALPPPPCPPIPACPLIPACPVPIVTCSCPAPPAVASSMSSLVGLAALWGACVAFFGPSFFTSDGRKFWKGLWKLLKDVWPPVKKFLKRCGEALSECCQAVNCCCPKRQKAVVDDAKNNLNGSRSTPDPSTTTTSASDTATATGTNFGPLSLLVRPSPQELPAPTVSPAVIPSVSSRIPTIGFGLPAPGRRHPIPRETVRPLGTNLGQAFHRPGKALAQGKGKDKDKDKITMKVAVAVKELKLH